MSWRARIEGEQFDLDALVTLFDCDPRIVKDGSDYFLESSRVDAHEDAADAHTELLEVISEVNGVCKAAYYNPKPIRFGGNLRHIKDDGSADTQVVYIGTATERLAREQWQRLGFALPSEIPDVDGSEWLKIAVTNERVAKALRLFGREPLRWADLTNVFECITRDAGERIEWGPETAGQVERFTRSANHHAASGDDARHAFSPYEQPPDPMDYDEACHFVRTLLHGWFRYLSAEQEPQG